MHGKDKGIKVKDCGKPKKQQGAGSGFGFCGGELILLRLKNDTRTLSRSAISLVSRSLRIF